MSEWTPKKAAVLGLKFSGASAVFLGALIVAMKWQWGRSPGQKDWSIVFAAAFGVPLVCCALAAVLSFVISPSLIVYKRLFGARRPAGSSLQMHSSPHRRKVRHPAIISFAGLAALVIAARLGHAILFLVGIPVFLITSAVAGGARSPTKIPLRDAIVYVGISVALVVGITVYVMYKH